MAGNNTKCECGEWSGEACEWSGPKSETVVVEFMPESLRSSHEAAGISGTSPANGALRIRVCQDCADLMVESDGHWCEIVEE